MLTIFVTVPVPDKLFEVGVIVTTLMALPRVIFDSIVQLQRLVGLFVISNEALDELSEAIVGKELYGLPFPLLWLWHS